MDWNKDRRPALKAGLGITELRAETNQEEHKDDPEKNSGPEGTKVEMRAMRDQGPEMNWAEENARAEAETESAMRDQGPEMNWAEENARAEAETESAMCNQGPEMNWAIEERRPMVRRAMALYAVTDRSWLSGRTLTEQVEEALLGGATCLQLREKDLDSQAFLKEAYELQGLARRFGVPFIINDDVEIAVACGADGVHVGQSDMEAGRVRERLGPDGILGVSVRTVEQALLAQVRGADYLGVGAVFPTGTKRDADGVSKETLRAICQAVDIPVVAIGGIDETNVLQLAGTGIDGVAVVSAIFSKPDIRQAAGGLLGLWRQIEGAAGSVKDNGLVSEGRRDAACAALGNEREKDEAAAADRRLRKDVAAEVGDGLQKEGAWAAADDLKDHNSAEANRGFLVDKKPWEAMAGIKGAVFDMDGTLTDSMAIWDTAGENFLRAKGVKPEPDIREALRPLSLRQAAEYFISEYGVKETIEEIIEGINRSIEDFYRHEVTLKPGAAEALKRFSQAGIKMCLATATDRHLVDAALERNGISGYFQDIFTCGEVGAGKDRPDIYKAALESLGVGLEQSVVFEDALFAAKTVKAAGMKLAVMEDLSAAAQREELRAIADVYMESWKDILQ